MKKQFLQTVSILLFLVILTMTAAAADKSPMRINFDKSLVSTSPVFTWEGTVSGDVNGALRTELRSLKVTGAVWQVEFDFIISAGSDSFTTRLNGILNTKTGQVVMNGIVTDAENEDLIGTQVHEEGQLVDPATSRFIGTIVVMPQS